MNILLPSVCQGLDVDNDHYMCSDAIYATPITYHLTSVYGGPHGHLNSPKSMAHLMSGSMLGNMERQKRTLHEQASYTLEQKSNIRQTIGHRFKIYLQQ